MKRLINNILILIMTLLIISGCGGEPKNTSYSLQTLTSDDEWQEMASVHGYTDNLEVCNNFIKSESSPIREFRCVVSEDKIDVAKKEDSSSTSLPNNTIEPESDWSLSNWIIWFIGKVVLISMLCALLFFLRLILPDVLLMLAAVIIILWILGSSFLGVFS